MGDKVSRQNRFAKLVLNLALKQLTGNTNWTGAKTLNYLRHIFVEGNISKQNYIRVCVHEGQII